jgi:hypothetical protein
MKFRVSVVAGAVVVAMTLASIAGASLLGQSGRAADGDPGLADLHMEGSVDQATAAVGDSITWHLTANDYNTPTRRPTSGSMSRFRPTFRSFRATPTAAAAA